MIAAQTHPVKSIISRSLAYELLAVGMGDDRRDLSLPDVVGEPKALFSRSALIPWDGVRVPS